MATKIISISVSEEDFNYVNDDSELSPTSIYRSALHKIKENRIGLKEMVNTLQKKCSVMQKRIFELQDVLEKEKNRK